jgi:hypothetical protein
LNLAPGQVRAQHAALLQEKISKRSIYGNGPVETRLQVPAGLIAEVREKCVDASDSFGGIDFIEFVFVSAVFYFYRENTVVRQVFEGNGRCRVQHADAQDEIIQSEAE